MIQVQLVLMNRDGGLNEAATSEPAGTGGGTAAVAVAEAVAVRPSLLDRLHLPANEPQETSLVKSISEVHCLWLFL